MRARFNLDGRRKKSIRAPAVLDYGVIGLDVLMFV
jgi:hypothetical protein